MATAAAGVAGPPQPFFHSRWVQAPEHVTDLGPSAGLPGGFRAAGVACAIKPSGNPDLGLLVCDSPAPASAARFADTAAPAAPVMLSRERCTLSSLRAILANSGCANAATGKRGMDDAAKTQGAAAMALGIEPSAVLLGSTGGHQRLPAGGQDARRHPRGPQAAQRRRRHELPAGDPDDRRLREARQPLRLAPLRRGAPERAMQGRGDDLAALRHDVLLRGDRRQARARDGRAAAVRVPEALVRPLLRRRPALHQRHRRADLLRGERSQGGARERGRAAPRRGAGRRSCDSSRS